MSNSMDTTTTSSPSPAPSSSSASPPNLHDVTSAAQFQSLLSADLNRVSLLYFWASWAEPCAAMAAVVKELAEKYKALLVLNIEADVEDIQDIADTFEIEAVPTFILLRGHTLLSRINGADALQLTKDVAIHANSSSPSGVPKPLSSTDRAPAAPSSRPTHSKPEHDGDDDYSMGGGDEKDEKEEETKEELNARLKALMEQDAVVLFMKGSPDVPRCGFSRTTVGILREHGVRFAHFDILSDESVRSGLKELNEWPTFPQLIVNGEFVGGLDILKEMVSNGEFSELVKDAVVKA